MKNITYNEQCTRLLYANPRYALTRAVYCRVHRESIVFLLRNIACFLTRLSFFSSFFWVWFLLRLNVTDFDYNFPTVTVDMS